MRWARLSGRVGYWLLVACGCALTTLLFVSVVNAMVRADRAETARAQTTAAATRRIDLLNERITTLQAQAVDNGERVGVLIAEIAALAEQVRQLGGEPVVIEIPIAATSTSTTSRLTPTTAPPSPTTTTRPEPPTPEPPTTTTTTRPCLPLSSAVGVCV